MDIRIATLEDLKKRRPDLYQAIKQEVCLGELRLTKDDVISMIEPLSENIKEHLKPYLSKLSTMTYNDIVDMENDIIDEVSEQLLNEFAEIESIVKGEKKRKTKRVLASSPIKEVVEPVSIIEGTCKLDLYIATLEDLKKYRSDLCDLLYEEFLKTYSVKIPTKADKHIEEVVNTVNGVKKGDAIRWNYTKEKGIVVGFEIEDGISNIIVQRFNGTKALFENDPKLFTILEGEEKADVVLEREKYKAELKERKDTGRALITSKKHTKSSSKTSSTSTKSKYFPNQEMIVKKARIGDMVQRKSDGVIGKVVEIKELGYGIERLILKLKDGSLSEVFNDTSMYYVLTDR